MRVSKASNFPGTILDQLREANPEIGAEEIEADDDFQSAMADCPFDLARLESQRLVCLHDWSRLLSPPEDIRSALDVICRRGRAQRGWEEEVNYRLDLRATALQGAAPEGKHLARARLDGAHLEGPNLQEADLRRAGLHKARLATTILVRAHLERANLRFAHLEGAILFSAHLENADLVGARLEWTATMEAHLAGAGLILCTQR
jgi:uncharacterized protein YjbI with pentapeptide repeats